MENREADEAEQQEEIEDIDKSVGPGSLPLTLDAFSSAPHFQQTIRKGLAFLFDSLTHTKLASRRRLRKSLKMLSSCCCSCCCWRKQSSRTACWDPNDRRLGFGPDAVGPGRQGRRPSCSPWRSVVCPVIVWTSVAMARPLGCCAGWFSGPSSRNRARA